MSVAKAKAVVPPASTFAELLRRSRFSSYDQAIAQTYTAPPASARRGNYGLKRAIPMTYKDSYISIPTFEHHAQFTDWNNAEQQVKFVKRMEEMNICPSPRPDASWDRALGEAQNQWLIDSEFAEVDYSCRPSAATSTPPPPPVPEEKEKVDDIRSFGKQGSRQYGSRRPLPTHNGVQLNIQSLSPKQFQRYLSQLRDLRPEFRAYITQQFESRYITQKKAKAMEKGKKPPSQEELDNGLSKKDESLLYVAAQSPMHKLHRQFLAEQFSKNYLEDPSSPTAPSKIKAQPHRFGGLIYHHPSMLQSILTSPPLPGIVLQDSPQTSNQFTKERSDNQKRARTNYLVLFGDVLAKLSPANAKALVPIYHPDTPDGVLLGGPDPLGSSTGGKKGAAAFNGDNDGSTRTRAVSFANSTELFRFTSYFMDHLPNVVSYKTQHQRPSELINQINIVADVNIDLPWHRRNLNNPHKPGSPEYISHVSANSVKRTMTYGSQMMNGSNNLIGYGSRFEEREAIARERRKRENFLAQSKGGSNYARGVGEQINSMGMGMGMGDEADVRAKTYSTLNGMMAGGNRPDGRDVDEDDEDLE
ncbi:hypothetical protein AGABI2DRAFT_190181 [Agaricus bisporus var. bisporus H97]|uniref:hypothetical protein n=1 Tax=Agaricus bisporus var. bisporus (strain H97 / ATCC MYA-4626 / FGSC 10389) TaxID=936046 RepID=UPI00029F59FF|nr:hypothetical protein AGABI2DRAFT_190181 [Agaricus bisporus var. bisporus H97]EKV49708.1 hypothetical protein AGABI2DRAFT_190181 [Agaricus bisporus var. bisporus H97]